MRRTGACARADWWFFNIGDGKRTCSDCGGEIAPDGTLCDGASANDCQYKQGDGDVPIHDWALEESLSAVIMQAELLLVSRDVPAIGFYLPLLNRTLSLVHSRMDAGTGLLLFGDSSNLLAPSYGAWLLASGTRAAAYLAGASVSFIAALDRVVELALLVGDAAGAAVHTAWRDAAVAALPALLAPSGDYFVKWVDPDGTLHGVLGQASHGYIEAVVNHDAVALGVAERVRPGLSEAIMARLTGPSVPPNPVTGGPGLRPYAFVITQAGGLDDMETPPTSWLWEYGTWVNGGGWATCEARMMLAYFRTGRAHFALESWRAMAGFAAIFRMDSPLVAWGSVPYQPEEPVNLVYDMWGVPGALIRGMWDPVYTADTLSLSPRLPRNLTSLAQRFPLMWGGKRLYVSAAGDPASGIGFVLVNSARWDPALVTPATVTLPWAALPAAPGANVTIEIYFAFAAAAGAAEGATGAPTLPPDDGAAAEPETPPPQQQQHPALARPPAVGGHPLHAASIDTAVRALRGALPPGVALWLDATTLAGTPDGAPVSFWPDLSGGGNNASHAAAGAPPVYRAAAMGGGRPAVEFDGATTYLEGPLALPAESTIIAAIWDRGSATPCCSGVFFSRGAWTGLSTRVLVTPGAPNATVVMIDWPGSADAGMRNIADTQVVAAVTYASTGATAHVDGCSDSTQGAVGRPGAGYMLGSRNAEDARYFSGSLAEMLVYPRALTHVERGAVEAYLLTKWPPGGARPPCVPLPNCTLPPALVAAAAKLSAFIAGMRAAGFADARYELAHAAMGAAAIDAWSARCAGLTNGTIAPLASAASEAAADDMYVGTASALYDGLGAVLAAYKGSRDPDKARIYQVWAACR